MLLAQDRARLFLWAAPAVIALSLTAIPVQYAPLVCVAHLFNPCREV
jgi:hypothetical protein